MHELERVVGEDSVYVAVMKRACRKENGARNGRARWNGRPA